MGRTGRSDEAEVIGTLYDAALGHVGWSEAGRALISTVDGATLTLTAQYRPAARST
jgi:hypothetical protein